MNTSEFIHVLLRMAEIVGLAASIVTLADLALRILSVTQKLLDLSRTAASLEDQIKGVAIPLKVSGHAIDIAFKTLNHRILSTQALQSCGT